MCCFVPNAIFYKKKLQLVNFQGWVGVRIRTCFFEIIFEFGPVAQEERSFTDISYLICVIIVVGLMRNNSVEQYCIWNSGSRGNAV